jgi:hypothetical protein
MVARSTIMPLGVFTVVMKLRARSMQKSKSMMRSLEGELQREGCLEHERAAEALQPEGPRVGPIGGTFIITAEADDDTSRKDEECVEDKENHEQIPALPKRMFVAHNVPNFSVTCDA